MGLMELFGLIEISRPVYQSNSFRAHVVASSYRHKGRK